MSDPSINNRYRFPSNTYPIVVIKLVVNDPSENRRSRQLFPTPEIFLSGLLIHPEIT